MSQNAHDTYLESRILSADPLELVRMLYQAAIARVREARRDLADENIAGRGRAITKAGEVLTELAVSLDHHRGGEISARLAELYDYMIRRLSEAHVAQDDAPMVEVLGLLTTLAEAWESASSPEPASPRVSESPWAASLPQEASSTTAAHAWQF